MARLSKRELVKMHQRAIHEIMQLHKGDDWIVAEKIAWYITDKISEVIRRERTKRKEPYNRGWLENEKRYQK